MSTSLAGGGSEDREEAEEGGRGVRESGGQARPGQASCSILIIS